MTGNRIDFYTKVHKALRAGLFGLSQRAASADAADPQSLDALAAEVRAMLERLSAHAGHEARFVHPLLREKLGQAFDADHAALEAEQEKLAAQAGRLAHLAPRERREALLGFYRELNRFIARYLEHLEGEERAMPRLWECCTDAELGAVMSRFAASRSADEALGDIGWMLPALSAAERKELLAGLVSAPRGPGAA
jgi:hypothetical protein